jgi:hypothetical protein
MDELFPVSPEGLNKPAASTPVPDHVPPVVPVTVEFKLMGDDVSQRPVGTVHVAIPDEIT